MGTEDKPPNFTFENSVNHIQRFMHEHAPGLLSAPTGFVTYHPTQPILVSPRITEEQGLRHEVGNKLTYLHALAPNQSITASSLATVRRAIDHCLGTALDEYDHSTQGRTLIADEDEEDTRLYIPAIRKMFADIKDMTPAQFTEHYPPHVRTLRLMEIELLFDDIKRSRTAQFQIFDPAAKPLYSQAC